MKKIFAIVIIFAMLFSLCSCNLSWLIGGNVDWDAHQKVDTVYYGVGVHIEELNNTCVFIPKIGHVSMPRTVDGEYPEFGEGDLVEIRFAFGADLSIMECFPARFAADAKDVKVKKANIGLEVVDYKTVVTVDIPEGLDVSVGDGIILMIKSVENEESNEVNYADCIVVEDVEEGRMTLSIDEDPTEIIWAMMTWETRFVKSN